MKNQIDKIVIVGGGTSGWMSASYMKKSYPDKEIIIIESPSVRRIGVGEATIPNLQTAFWDHLGIPEEQWMKRVNATYKMGIKFVNWANNPIPNKDDYYYHLFGVSPNCDDIPLSHYWNYKRLIEGNNNRFDYTCYKEPAIADKELSPMTREGKKTANYAWHFDANLVVDYLKELCLDWGVKLIEEHVETANIDNEGMITEVLTKEKSVISGDLFIDCTGFRSILIEKIMKEPFIDLGDTLLCNSAVATQIPSEKEGLTPYTYATAHSAGWSWNIPLLGRSGRGYVFSDHFQSTDQAIEEFSQFMNIDPNKQSWNKIKFRVGRRRNAWVKNCVAIGLARNFLEPLESTAMYLTYGSLYQLTRFFPNQGFDENLRNKFNEEVNYSYDDCHAFIQMHYVTTKRDDTAFWRANQYDLKILDGYEDKLKAYKSGVLINDLQTDTETYYNNLELEYRNFWTEGSYYSILTGMGIFPEKVNPKLLNRPESIEKAQKIMDDLRKTAEELVGSLPSNYEYLKKFHGEMAKVKL